MRDRYITLNSFSVSVHPLHITGIILSKNRGTENKPLLPLTKQIGVYQAHDS